MDRAVRHSLLRSAASPRFALVLLIVVLGVGGYFLTSRTIRSDRDAAASRHAQVEVVQTQEVLQRARAYVEGLADVLSTEPRAKQARFARLASATAASVGLNDVLWVQEVPRSERKGYERRLGAPIRRLTGVGRFERAPAASSYLAATFASRAPSDLRPGLDVSAVPALAAAIHDRATVFAVTASAPGWLGGEPGFYLLEAAGFGRGPDSRGFLVAFVPRGWFATTLGGDPRRVAISQDGRLIEGDLGSAQAAASFDALGRRWRIDVARDPPSGLQSTLPWLALAWPFAAMLIAFGVGSEIGSRRRAEREFEEIFNLSLDLLAIGGFDGYLKRVNPAFEEAFGYSSQELVSRPFLDFVHPDSRTRSREALDQVVHGEEVVLFENRNVRADGSTLWLEVSCRPMPSEGVFYGSARDITDRKRSEDELREAHRMAEASRDELRVRAAEEAALRRVATLVASGVSPAEVFTAVAEEVRRLFDADTAFVARFEDDGAVVVIVGLAQGSDPVPIERRWVLEDTLASAQVYRTGQSARLDADDLMDASGPVAGELRRMGIRSSVAGPIVVEGRLWGVIVVSSKSEPLASDTEERMAKFTELVATTIANAEAKAELAASRARVVTATAEERQRMVRDLHDGAQQRLVHAVISLKLALREARNGDGNAEVLVGEALGHAEQANSDLRELVHGILPSVLTSGGLRAGIEELASRSSLPVTTYLSVERLPSAIEATAYFVVSETLTNVMKHSGAHGAQVNAKAEGRALRVEVRDDGIGGADPGRGSGLTGLRDRVEALGGTIEITSPAGTGTLVVVEIPIQDG